MKAKLIFSFSAIAFFAFSAAKMLAGGIDFPQSAHCPSDGDKVTQNALYVSWGVETKSTEFYSIDPMTNIYGIKKNESIFPKFVILQYCITKQRILCWTKKTKIASGG